MDSMNLWISCPVPALFCTQLNKPMPMQSALSVASKGDLDCTTVHIFYLLPTLEFLLKERKGKNSDLCFIA